MGAASVVPIFSMANIVINFTENDYTRLLPIQQNTVPFVLTPAYQDVPQAHVLNLQSFTSLGLWIELDSAVDVYCRLVALKDRDGTEVYPLPIHTAFKDYVELKPQEFKLIDGTYKLFFSIPVADMLNYCKLQFKGAGNILSLTGTAKGKF